jgi:hypothetical protein
MLQMWRRKWVCCDTRLWRWQVDDELLGAVAAACPALRALSCGSCQAVTDAGISSVAAALPGLQRLCADDCARLTSSALRALSLSCRSLQAREPADPWSKPLNLP